jgi:ribosomal-protein-alanine N-acetyltransferase
MNKRYFEKIPILTSDRLILRGIERTDIPAIVDLSAYDGFFATIEVEALTILDKVNLDREKGDSIQWGIQLKEEKDIIGTCSYHRGYPNNVGEIGYALKPTYRRQGIMTEAVKLITDFGLNVMGLKNVVAYVAPNNIASANVLRRAGFHQVENEGKDLKFSIRSKSAVL